MRWLLIRLNHTNLYGCHEDKVVGADIQKTRT